MRVAVGSLALDRDHVSVVHGAVDQRGRGGLAWKQCRLSVKSGGWS